MHKPQNKNESANMAPKILKQNCATEGSWKYMGDLALDHAPTMRRYVSSIFPLSWSKRPRSKRALSEANSWQCLLISRVMILVYHQLNRDEKLFPRKSLQWKYLTRKERKRVREMINEARDNDLLEEMLHWFSAKYMDKDEVVIEATKALQWHVVQGVRLPKMYQVE